MDTTDRIITTLMVTLIAFGLGVFAGLGMIFPVHKAEGPAPAVADIEAGEPADSLVVPLAVPPVGHGLAEAEDDHLRHIIRTVLDERRKYRSTAIPSDYWEANAIGLDATGSGTVLRVMGGRQAEGTRLFIALEDRTFWIDLTPKAVHSLVALLRREGVAVSESPNHGAAVDTIRDSGSGGTITDMEADTEMVPFGLDDFFEEGEQ